jgi:hypothetical protein
MGSLRDVLERAGFCVERMEYTFGRRGMTHHHSLGKMSRWRRALVYLMDAADDEKVPSELGVMATRELSSGSRE